MMSFKKGIIKQSAICLLFATAQRRLSSDSNTEKSGNKTEKGGKQKTPPKRGSKLVGERGFEPPTHWSQTSCATKLRYSPKYCFLTF